MPPFSSAPHDAIRKATAELHALVESRTDLPARLCSPDAYRAWLEQLVGFVEPAERLIGSLSWPAGLDVQARRKTPLLIADLTQLGLSAARIASIPRSSRIPPSADLSSALGWLYVLEGSALGGRIILRNVQAALGTEGVPGRYFSGYGPATGAIWRAFLTELTAALTTPDSVDAAVEGARAAFLEFDRWVNGAGATVPAR